MGTTTRKDLHVLCYEHHTEMLLKSRGDSPEGLLYACREAGCLIRYDSSRGYFIDAEDASTVEREITPHVSCPDDGHPMYLAKVAAETPNFRLWKCPECTTSRTNGESSYGLGKKVGA